MNFLRGRIPVHSFRVSSFPRLADYHVTPARGVGSNLIERKYIHLSPERRVGEPLIIGCGIAAVAYGGKLVFEAISARQEKNAESKQSKDDRTESQKPSFFASFFQARFYEGGFEDKMTRREAALILGVRETSDKKRIMTAHRKLAILNHPDSGGSTYLTAKINEAKDKLLGGD